MSDEQKLLAFNVNGALNGFVAAEEHAIGNNGITINSWCIQKHLRHSVAGHHLTEAIQITQETNPTLSEKLALLKIKVEKEAEHPSAAGIRDLRNEFRALVHEKTYSQPCGTVCQYDRAKSLNTTAPLAVNTHTHSRQAASLTESNSYLKQDGGKKTMALSMQDGAVLGAGSFAGKGIMEIGAMLDQKKADKEQNAAAGAGNVAVIKPGRRASTWVGLGGGATLTLLGLFGDRLKVPESLQLFLLSAGTFAIADTTVDLAMKRVPGAELKTSDTATARRAFYGHGAARSYGHPAMHGAVPGRPINIRVD